MKKKLMIIAGVLLVVLAIGGSIGYYLYHKPVKDFSNAKSDMILEAKDIFNEFVQDEQAANAKYVAGDKTIEVSGKLNEIIKNEDGSVTLIIDVGDPDGDLSCTIIKDDADYGQSLQIGSDVKIKGQCTGYQELINKEVIMIRCGIVKPSNN